MGCVCSGDVCGGGDGSCVQWWCWSFPRGGSARPRLQRWSARWAPELAQTRVSGGCPRASVGQAGGPPHTWGPPLWHLLLPQPCVWGQMRLPGGPALPASAWPQGSAPSPSGEGLRSCGEKEGSASHPWPQSLAASGAIPSDPLCRPLGRAQATGVGAMPVFPWSGTR